MSLHQIEPEDTNVETPPSIEVKKRTLPDWLPAVIVLVAVVIFAGLLTAHEISMDVYISQKDADWLQKVDAFKEAHPNHNL